MSKLKNIVRNYWQNDSGVAAVEFGFIAPVIALLMFGGLVIFQSVKVDRSVDRASAITADLISRQIAITPADVDRFTEIARSLLGEPGLDESFEVAMSSISNTFDTDGDYDLNIDWTFSNKTGGELKLNEISKFKIPFIPEGESVILVNVILEYDRLLYAEDFARIRMGQASTRRPRFATMVPYN